jgi:hypothetical protein
MVRRVLDADRPTAVVVEDALELLVPEAPRTERRAPSALAQNSLSAWTSAASKTVT